MKKFLIRSVFYMIFLALGYILLAGVWGAVMPQPVRKNLPYKFGGKGFLFSRLQELKNTRDIDILFVGSSLSIRGFDPRIFDKYGYRTFNLGSGGQTPLQSEWLIKKYLTQLNPRLVIIEVNPYTLSRDGVEPALDLISNHHFDPGLATMVLHTTNIKVLNAYIYSLWHELSGAKRNTVEKSTKGEDTYIAGGFVEQQLTRFHPSKFKESEKQLLGPLPVQEKALENLVNHIKENNIPLLLVQPPVSKFFLHQHPGAFDSDPFYQSLGTYYNFNHLHLLIDTVHFSDSRHLNREGVGIFNEYLIKNTLSKENF